MKLTDRNKGMCCEGGKTHTGAAGKEKKPRWITRPSAADVASYSIVLLMGEGVPLLHFRLLLSTLTGSHDFPGRPGARPGPSLGLSLALGKGREGHYIALTAALEAGAVVVGGFGSRFQSFLSRLKKNIGHAAATNSHHLRP